ncbi:MAG: glycosyltransferase, partial [Planctomycetaceae bacterium]
MAELPLRVLLLDGELTFRGSSLLTLRIARGLEKRELETALVCTTCDGLDPALLQGVRLHEIPGLDVPVWGRLVARTVYRDIKDQRPDVIHLFDSRLLNTASRLAEKLKRPLLLSVGGHDEAESLVLRNPVPQLKSIISVSESVQSRLPAGPVMDQLEKQVILPGVE